MIFCDKISRKLLKFCLKRQKKAIFRQKIYGQKLILLTHSGENEICPKLSKILFNSFSVKMGQKYVKFG
jgi:hypothetical protein